MSCMTLRRSKRTLWVAQNRVSIPGDHRLEAEDLPLRVLASHTILCAGRRRMARGHAEEPQNPTNPQNPKLRSQLTK